MAISPMQKVAIIAPKEGLDKLLLSLQSLRHLDIRDLQKEEVWQTAFLTNQVTRPGMFSTSDGHKVLSVEEALNQILKRQQIIEGVIRQLKSFLPQKSLFQSLRQKRRQLTFNDVEIASQKSQEEELLKQIRELLEEHDDLLDKIEQLDTQQVELSKWVKLETTPDSLSRFRHIRAFVGTIPNTADNAYFKTLKAESGFKYQEIFRSETEYGILLVLHPELDIQALETIGFKQLDYPYKELPLERLAIWQKEKERVQKRQKEIEAKLGNAQSSLEALEAELEATSNHYVRELAKKQLANNQYLVAIEGWIEHSAVDTFKTNLLKEFGENIWIQETDVTEDDWENTPVKLINHPLVAPFEMITEMYALPKYHEKDPTPYLAPLYLTFFGMMVADLGYGLFMIIATGLALRAFELTKEMRRFLKFFNILGVAVSFWGVVYGSFLSYDLPIKLISTTNDVMTILVLSVVFGFITVLIGLYLFSRQKIKVKAYAEAYTSGFAWCFILLGILGLAVGNIIPAFSYLAPIGKWLAITNAVGILVISVISTKSLVGLGSGLYNLYNATGYISDLVSFTRLMALGVSGASIGAAFNMIIGMLPVLARFSIGIVLFIGLHMINLGLSLLSGYVHGARLIFVEFFGKFYEGGGRAFNPLKPTEKYFDIKNVHLEDK